MAEGNAERDTSGRSVNTLKKLLDQDHSAAFTERVTTVAENITHELGFFVHRINKDNPTITVPRRKSGHLDRPKAWND